jgi:hypothetical protein
MPTDDGRIMTRSRAKARECINTPVQIYHLHYIEPDRFTIVPASLKILKVLVEELHSASGAAQNLEAAAMDQLDEEDSENDGEWEDEEDFGIGVKKSGRFLYSPK